MKKGAYAVIFTNRLRDPAPGYEAVAADMDALAESQTGYLGHQSFQGEDGDRVTISYWESDEAIADWRAHAEHLTAQRMGRETFYKWFRLEVCRIERLYDFEASA